MLNSPGVTLWNINPLVATLEGFATPEECNAAIHVAGGHLERAPTVGVSEAREISDQRTNTRAQIDHRRDGWLNGLCLKISNLLRIPASHSEPINVLNYQPGEQFHPHSDGFDLYDQSAAEELARGGQRLFTSIIYLNDVPEGGETVFPALDLTIPPLRGSVLIFGNCWAGERDLCSHSVHAGTPVISGEKWAATFWWREQPYQWSE